VTGTKPVPRHETLDPRDVRKALARALVPFVRVDGDADLLTDAVNAVADTLVSDDVLTLLHLAVENKLVDFRDSGMWVEGPRNGFVIKTREGYDSDVMRLGTRDGLRVALQSFQTEGPRL
jgi:hypothetical protein